MDDALYFSEQHLAVREMVRTFARDKVAPVAAKFDAEATFPWENVKTMGELGLLGIPWPEELGGAGLDQITPSRPAGGLLPTVREGPRNTGGVHLELHLPRDESR